MFWKPDEKTCSALSAEDVCRIALSAYYAAARGSDLGEADLDGVPWGPGDDVMPAGQFVVDLQGHFSARLLVHARKLGIEESGDEVNVRALIAKLEADFSCPEGNGLPDAEKVGNNQYSGRICGI